MEDRDVRELTEAVSDLTAAAEGIGYELEALNMSVRAATAYYTDTDPLEGSLYAAQGDPSEAPPEWVNGPTPSEATPEKYPPPPRSNMGAPVGLLIICAALAVFTAIVVMYLWA